MPRPFIILVILFLATRAAGQESRPRIDSTNLKVSAADSTVQKVNIKAHLLQDSILNKLNPLGGDSILQKANSKLKSVKEGLTHNHKFDSLKRLGSLHRFKDSLNIQSWASGMRSKVTSKISIDSLGYARKIDSLKTLELPTKGYRRKLDSLQRKKTQLLGEINGKHKDLQQKVTQRYGKWTASARDRFKLDSLGVKLPGTELNNLPGELKNPTTGLEIPKVNGISGNLNVPNANGIPGMPDLPALNTGDFADLGLSDDLVKTGGNLSVPSMDQLQQWNASIPDIGGVQGQLKEYTGMLKEPSGAAESAVGQIAEVNDVTKQLSQAEQLKQSNEALQLAEKMKDEESIKEEAKRLATNEAINHFAGHELVLQSAMDQMSKYKKKYSNLNSLSEVKKSDWLPRNGLKGRPFRERFRVGMHMGVQNLKDTLIIDFYPNVSYKISGRLEMGAGAIYRIREVKSNWTMDQRNPVWGFAGFGIFKTFKSTYFRAEVDANSYSKPVADDVQPSREWRWSFLAGTQTNFKISKRVTGNVQLLFNFDKNIKDVFPEKLTMRFGVQYKLPARKVKTAAQSNQAEAR